MINWIERKRKKRLMEEHGYFKALSGNWCDNHYRRIDNLLVRKLTYQELENYLRSRP